MTKCRKKECNGLLISQTDIATGICSMCRAIIRVDFQKIPLLGEAMFAAAMASLVAQNKLKGNFALEKGELVVPIQQSPIDFSSIRMEAPGTVCSKCNMFIGGSIRQICTDCEFND